MNLKFLESLNKNIVRKGVVMKKVIFASVFLLCVSHAQALSIDWTGNYRIEYVGLNKTSLDTPGLPKTYILNHLSLSPKIIAADGLNESGFQLLGSNLKPKWYAFQFPTINLRAQ